MSDTANFLAVDIGAASGRVIVGHWNGTQFALEELHRFSNGPIEANQHLYWDVQRLWQEILTGLTAYTATHTAPLTGIGIDTWAVDHGLFDSHGKLLGNPYHYRDPRTNAMPAFVDTIIEPSALYAQTGIQRLPLNSMYQLVAALQQTPSLIEQTQTMLLMPDVFHYWLTGKQVAEYTNATTTMCLDAQTRQWATPLLAALHIPQHIFPAIIQPGTLLGTLLPAVVAQTGLDASVPVIAVGTHDTASAVAAIPGLDTHSAYISSGTWSLVGVELDQPILTEQARQLNFTNEGGVAGTIRFLKNVSGLWLLQECQRAWEHAGEHYTWAELVALAEAAPALRSLIDPDAPVFSAVGDMPAIIRQYCEETHQPVPASIGAIVRCCLESLALKYRWVVTALERLANRTITTVRVVGGGSQNALLCQLTADACKRPVIAGPTEGTALGNMLVQAIATGHIADLAMGRQAVAASVPQKTYLPRSSEDWDAAIIGFEALVAATQGY